MADLLIELGCEELPASASVPLTAGLAEGLHKALVAAGLVTETAAPVCHSTPRRMAVYWPEVGERQADQQIERRGPAVKAAWQDGEVGGTPSKALAGFLLSAGASVDDIVTVETPKGVWVAVNVNKTGQTIDELLAESLPDVLGKLPMPRRMHWGGDVHEFLRPVVWLLASSRMSLKQPRLLAVRLSLMRHWSMKLPLWLNGPWHLQASLKNVFSRSRKKH